MPTTAQARYFPCPSCGGVNRVPADKVANHPTCGRCKAALPTEGAPILLDDDALARLIQASPVPVLVDFYADWCGPCRMLAPVLDQLARQHAGRLVVAKVDTERHQRIAGQLGVQGIPAVFLYVGGRVVDQGSGFQPLPAWQRMVGPHLA
jgi:thioredoxin 2